MQGLGLWVRRLFLKEKGKSSIDDLFAPVDPKKVSEELDIDFLARQAGERNLPSSDATIKDANELNIAHVFEEDAQATAKRANDKLQIFRRSINHLDIQDDQQIIESAGDRFESDSAALLQECKDKLKPYVTRRGELTAELNDFKHRNRLTRGADYPDSRFLFIAVLITIFVAESVMNGFFFAAGSDFGLIGGWVNAMQYALVNLAVAFLVSLALVRQINHVGNFRKVIGFLGIVFLLVFVPAFNFFVGHFREIYAEFPDEAQKLAVQSFMADPLVLSTVESWLLLAIGIVFAGIAIFEGYRIEDPYPGYGHLSRRVELARDLYSGEKEALKNLLSDLRDSIILELDEARSRVLQREDELNDLASMAEMIRERFNAHLALLQHTCHVVLSNYRQINQGIRTTPAPAYFQQQYEFSTSLSLSLPDTISVDEVNQRKQSIRAVLDLIGRQRDYIQEEYTEDLKSIDHTIQELEYGVR